MEEFDSVEVYKNDIFFNCSTRMLIFGGSNTGKTFLVEQLVRLHHTKFHKIIICGTRNKLLDFKETAKITRHFKSPKNEDVIYNPFSEINELHEGNHGRKQILIIYDDLLDLVCKSDVVSKLFIKGRHHNLSVIVILQTFFPKNVSSNNLAAVFKCNATHYLFTKSASMGEVQCLAGKIEFSRDYKRFFLALYKRLVLGKRYGYLCVQLDVSNERMKYMTNILFEDKSKYYMVHSK